MRTILFILMVTILSTLSSAAIYEFITYPGATLNSSFTVVPNDIKSMNTISPFKVSLYQTTFSDQNHDTKIDYSMIIPKQIQAGSYYTYIVIAQEKEYSIIVNGTTVDTYYETTQIENTVKINVVEYVNYSIVNLGANIINTDSPSIGRINVSLLNDGNTNVVTKISSNELFDSSSMDILLAPFTNYTFSLPYSIPKDQSGIKIGQIIVTHINSVGQTRFPDKNLSISFNITDKTPPILNVTIPTYELIYNDNYELCWNTSDASGIKGLNYSFMGNNVILPQNIGCTAVRMNSSGNIEIKVSAVDNYNNVNTLIVPLIVNKIDIGIVNNGFRFRTIKPNTKTSMLLMHLTRPVTINMSLTYIFNTNYTDSRIVPSIESPVANVLLTPGQSYTTDLSGDVYLSIQGNYVGDYSVQLNIVFPEWTRTNNATTINAIGSIKDYTMCQNGIIDIWGREFNSTPVDSGNLEDSYCMVCGRYDVNYDIASSAIPCTKEQENDLKNNYLNQLATLKANDDSEINMRNWIIGGLVLLMLSAAAILLFMFFGKKNRMRIGG